MAQLFDFQDIEKERRIKQRTARIISDHVNQRSDRKEAKNLPTVDMIDNSQESQRTEGRRN